MRNSCGNLNCVGYADDFILFLSDSAIHLVLCMPLKLGSNKIDCPLNY